MQVLVELVTGIVASSLGLSESSDKIYRTVSHSFS